MRKVLILFAAILFVVQFSSAQEVVTARRRAASGGINPAFVQGATGFSASASTIAVTLGSAVTAGHALFVFEASTSQAPSTPTATGETFTTFTGASGCQNFIGDAIQCYATTSAAGGETTVNCNFVSATPLKCVVVEFTRPQGLSTPVDAGGNSENGAAVSLAVSTSAATTNANDFVVSCAEGFNVGSNPITFPSPFTEPASLSQSDANGEVACGYNVASSTGVQSVTPTWTTSMRAGAMILAVKP